MLQNLKSKFAYITYPFFGTYSVPDLQFDFDKLKAALHKNYTTLKLSNSSNYLEELLRVELDENETRFKFQLTALSTQALIMLPHRCQWGVDIEGKIHNLARYEEFRSRCVKPVKVTNNNLVWFKGISRPIRTPLSIKNIKEDILYYWYQFLYIDNVWELYKISTEYNGKETQWI